MDKKLIEDIKKIVNRYKKDLLLQINERKEEMQQDNNDHYLMYSLLGIPAGEDVKIDLYQNIGRFVYKYAGSMLEEIVIYCFQRKFPNSVKKKKLENNFSSDPKTVEIDLLNGNKAHEIKWRDATTDGDHIKKEKNRIHVILNYGYTPVRLMFFEPNRKQAITIQSNLKKLYEEVGGEYYGGTDAWNYLLRETDVDLKSVLEVIIQEDNEKKGGDN